MKNNNFSGEPNFKFTLKILITKKCKKIFKILNKKILIIIIIIIIYEIVRSLNNNYS